MCIRDRPIGRRSMIFRTRGMLVTGVMAQWGERGFARLTRWTLCLSPRRLETGPLTILPTSWGRKDSFQYGQRKVSSSTSDYQEVPRALVKTRGELLLAVSIWLLSPDCVW